MSVKRRIVIKVCFMAPEKGVYHNAANPQQSLYKDKSNVEPVFNLFKEILNYRDHRKKINHIEYEKCIIAYSNYSNDDFTLI